MLLRFGGQTARPVKATIVVVCAAVQAFSAWAAEPIRHKLLFAEYGQGPNRLCEVDADGKLRDLSGVGPDSDVVISSRVRLARNAAGCRFMARAGADELGIDPVGLNETDMFMTLKPRKLWKKARDQAELTTLIDKHLRDMPGQRLTVLQPIEMRMNEMVSGIRSDVAVKLYGDDLAVLSAKAAEIEAILAEQGEVSFNCEFCLQSYRFSPERARQLFAAPSAH